MMTYVTMAVLAGAYRGKDLDERALLTHAVCVESGKALCRVKADNLVDDGRTESEPTCPRCQAALARLEK